MQAVFSWPIQIIFGPEVAYNFVMIIQIALCGFAAWLLTWKVTGDPKASFAALFIYEMSPHLLGQSYNGISETVCAEKKHERYHIREERLELFRSLP